MGMRKITAVLIAVLSVFVLASCAGKGSGGLTEEQQLLFEKICAADEALELSKKTGAVVFETRGCTSGKNTWEEFCNNTSKKKPASVLCAYYYELDRERVSEELYEEEKDMYPQLFFSLIEYDGNEYKISTRMSTDEKPETVETYQYMIRQTGKAPSESSLFDSYDYYLLVDDPSVTWDDISRALFSSQMVEIPRFSTVYQDYTGWKDN